jgi:hypothetical protein
MHDPRRGERGADEGEAKKGGGVVVLLGCRDQLAREGEEQRRTGEAEAEGESGLFDFLLFS